jgi:tRNA nucleotidyltransferase/poly(A) polymerase
VYKKCIHQQASDTFFKTQINKNVFTKTTTKKPMSDILTNAMNMEEQILDRLNKHPALFFVQDFLDEHPNADLFLVGGAVRDALMGRKMHGLDFDFVIGKLSPEEIENWFGNFGKVNLVGQHFGVYKFMPTGFNTDTIEFIDIALPRTEEVAKGSLGGYKDFDIQSDKDLPIEDDLARRDFTINAMAFDIRKKTLIDPFNGQNDIKGKTLRAVGIPEERFSEDLSRILRGIRFASELHFNIEEETSKAIQKLIKQVNQTFTKEEKTEYVVPREIIGIELAKAFNRSPVRAMRECLSHGVLHEIFPKVMRIIEVDEGYVDPLFEVRSNELTVTLTLLLRCLDPLEAKEALRFSGLDTLARNSSKRIEIDVVAKLIERLQFGYNTEEVFALPASQFEKQFMNGNGAVLARCFELIGKGDVAQAARDRRRDIENRWLVDHDERIAPLLSGNDIMSQGINAGPLVRIWLEKIRDLQLDGSLMSREQALKWLKENINNEVS